MLAFINDNNKAKDCHFDNVQVERIYPPMESREKSIKRSNKQKPTMKKTHSIQIILCTILILNYIPIHQCHEDEESDSYHENVHSEHHVFVTCGSMIKLAHLQSNYRLHSHDVAYGSGSGQQSITGYPNVDDPNSLWVVRAPHGKICTQGDPIQNGATVRFQHYATKKYLHSHLHQSPLSKQQEVSGFGENDHGDTGDNWKVKMFSGGGKNWRRDDVFYLQHVDTSNYLSLTKNSFKNPIPGQREIVCSSKMDESTKWKAEEGIYFPHS